MRVLRSSRSLALVLVALLSLLAAACGGGGEAETEESPAPAEEAATEEATEEEPTEEAAGEVEDPDITLGLLPIVDVAPVHIALAEGYFEDEGLNVELAIVQGGAAAIPAVVSGELDIAFGNFVSFFLATDEGIDLRLIADQDHDQPGFSSILTLPDSGIDGAADLVGRNLAVNTLNNVVEISARAQVSDAGGNPDDVNYVEVPFPDMPATLERGDVDAIWAVEPFVSIAQDTLDAVEVINPYDGRLAGFPVAGFQTTTEYAEQNPNTVAAFQRAMIRASTEASEDPERVVKILPEYTELTPEAAAGVSQPQFLSELDPEELTRVPELMVEFGMIEEVPDVNSLIVPTP